MTLPFRFGQQMSKNTPYYLIVPSIPILNIFTQLPEINPLLSPISYFYKTSKILPKLPFQRIC
jgi:hypothetical protein